MLRKNIVALIGLLAVVNGSKWLFDGKRLPTLGLAYHSITDIYHAVGQSSKSIDVIKKFVKKLVPVGQIAHLRQYDRIRRWTQLFAA